jgi:hypothetical protein
VGCHPTPRTSCCRPLEANVVPLSSSSKSKSKWLDPCQEAASKSIKCLNRNGGDRTMCQEYFECVSLPTSRADLF